jgi:hypothetical protein
MPRQNPDAIVRAFDPPVEFGVTVPTQMRRENRIETDRRRAAVIRELVHRGIDRPVAETIAQKIHLPYGQTYARQLDAIMWPAVGLKKKKAMMRPVPKTSLPKRYQNVQYLKLVGGGLQPNLPRFGSGGVAWSLAPDEDSWLDARRRKVHKNAAMQARR